jgi:predicted type IV restriction endonuclease
MSPVRAIAQFIDSYEEVHRQFNLARTDDPNFFPEWSESLSPLTDTERLALDRIKRRYLTHRSQGLLTEATVILLVIAPLLELAGFYDPPFYLRAEETVEIEINDPETTLRGRIDVLVLQDHFWALVVEAKNTQFTPGIAIPQCLAYMMGARQYRKPVFGLVTNGEEFMFLKVLQQENAAQYEISRVFSLLPRQNELYEVLGCLKTLGSLYKKE